MTLKALVSRIIPFSYVDGPGNRTAIFFQGCGFKCLYCHNPETINLCNHCGQCVPGCPVQALSLKDGKVRWNPTVCCSCDQCIQVCTNYSSPKVRMLTVEEVWHECEPALPYIQGITASGGECTRQHEFLTELFALAHAKGKTTLVDTNGQTLFSAMPRLTSVMDMATLDVKAFDAGQHQKLTGCDNETVLKNIRYLAEIEKLHEIRTVVAPNTDYFSTVREVSKIIAEYPKVRYRLIRFRNWGVRGEMQNLESPSMELLNELKTLAQQNGVREVEIT